MKLGFEIAYMFVAVAVMIFWIRASFNKKKIAQDIQWVMGFAFFSVITSLAQLMTSNAFVANLAFSLFFISIDWLLVSLVYFANNYCNIHFERFVHPFVYVVISAVDTIQLLLNPWLSHAFQVSSVEKNGTIYWNYAPQSAFQVHLCWCYVLFAILVLIFLYKRTHVPQMYKVKYDRIILLLSIVVVMDAIHLIFRTLVDYSVLGYPMAAVAVYYYAVSFMPRALVHQTLEMTVGEIPDGVIVTDSENCAIYSNEAALRILGLKREDAPRFKELFEDWCKKHYQSMDTNFIYDWTRTDGEKKQYLRVHYRRLLDDKKQFLGCYLNIQERTEEIELLLKERYAATHDFLTGLYSREYFYKQVQQCLSLHPQEHYLMICSDVSNFKMINDVFGKKAADQLLIDIADALRHETISGEVYGRLVNDQFALLMRKRDYREMKFAVKTSEIMKISNKIAYPLKIYLGVYEIDDTTLPISVMCDRAMLALETIKGDYQRLVAYYDETLRHHVLEEQELAAGLDRAIREGEIELYVQPQITVDGRCMGGEALVRWNHPRRGLLPPGAFIASFERNGLIATLDMHVWELACRQLKAWKDAGFGDRYLSVNISPKDFFFIDIYKEIISLVHRFGIDPANLKLEITETAVMSDLPKQLSLIKRLQAAGFTIEMDDFGSGFSSLNMLKDICVDVLKIDMDFLRQSDSENRSRIILKTVIALAKELGMPVITEGVETKEHVDFLTQIGCDVFQGYYFGRPMKVADYEKKYMA